jgi:hypothetical protein
LRVQKYNFFFNYQIFFLIFFIFSNNGFLAVGLIYLKRLLKVINLTENQ